MKRIAELFVTVCFLAFLVIGLAVTVLRPRESVSFYENRALAAFPWPTAQSLGDGSFTTQLEVYLDDHAALRNSLLVAKTHIDLALHRPVVSGIVVTGEYLLPFLYPEQLNREWLPIQIAAYADNLKRISDTVGEYGGYYCYVGVPCQYSYFEDKYPWYLYNRTEFSQLLTTELAKETAARGVNYLDMRAVFDGMGHPDEYGSKVDNHYSLEGAFAAYQVIMEKVAADTGLDFPILGPDNVTFESLPNDYIGSRERRLINVVTREEHLSVLYPKVEIPFERSDNGLPSDSFIYVLPATPEEPVLYTMYMGGDIANTVIDTHREELPTILIYGDSFTNAIECVAYLSFDEMHSLDLRHFQAMSLEEYIREVQPDVVIGIRDFEALVNSNGNGAIG